MDLTVPIEGAAGGTATLILYGLVQLVKSKFNGGRGNRFPCQQHAEKLAILETRIEALTLAIERLTLLQNTAYGISRTAENATVTVLNEQGERIASLEATSVSTASGIVRIEVSLKEIEKALRERKSL